MGYDEITQSPGNEMEYPMQVDQDENEDQQDEEIRRQLGWYLVPLNADIIDAND